MVACGVREPSPEVVGRRRLRSASLSKTSSKSPRCLDALKQTRVETDSDATTSRGRCFSMCLRKDANQHTDKEAMWEKAGRMEYSGRARETKRVRLWEDDDNSGVPREANPPLHEASEQQWEFDGEGFGVLEPEDEVEELDDDDSDKAHAVSSSALSFDGVPQKEFHCSPLLASSGALRKVSGYSRTVTSSSVAGPMVAQPNRFLQTPFFRTLSSSFQFSSPHSLRLRTHSTNGATAPGTEVLWNDEVFDEFVERAASCGHVSSNFRIVNHGVPHESDGEENDVEKSLFLNSPFAPRAVAQGAECWGPKAVEASEASSSLTLSLQGQSVLERTGSPFHSAATEGPDYRDLEDLCYSPRVQQKNAREPSIRSDWNSPRFTYSPVSSSSSSSSSSSLSDSSSNLGPSAVCWRPARKRNRRAVLLTEPPDEDVTMVSSATTLALKKSASVTLASDDDDDDGDDDDGDDDDGDDDDDDEGQPIADSLWRRRRRRRFLFTEDQPVLSMSSSSAVTSVSDSENTVIAAEGAVLATSGQTRRLNRPRRRLIRPAILGSLDDGSPRLGENESSTRAQSTNTVSESPTMMIESSQRELSSLQEAARYAYERFSDLDDETPKEPGSEDALILGVPIVSLSETCCAICLRATADALWIGRLDPCEHMFCFECIQQWADCANVCPLCKRHFPAIQKVKRNFGALDTEANASGMVIEVISVAHRVLRNSGDVSGTRDANGGDAVVSVEIEAQECVCELCRCGDDEEVLLLCDGCNDAYHTYCVGLGGIPEGSWYCGSCMRQRSDSRAQHSAGRQAMQDVIEFYSRAYHARRQRRRRARNTAERLTSRGRAARRLLTTQTRERLERQQSSVQRRTMETRNTRRRHTASLSSSERRDTESPSHRGPMTRRMAAEASATESSASQSGAGSLYLEELPRRSRRNCRQHQSTFFDDDSLENRVRRRWQERAHLLQQ